MAKKPYVVVVGDPKRVLGKSEKEVFLEYDVFCSHDIQSSLQSRYHPDVVVASVHDMGNVIEEKKKLAQEKRIVIPVVCTGYWQISENHQFGFDAYAHLKIPFSVTYHIDQLVYDLQHTQPPNHMNLPLQFNDQYVLTKQIATGANGIVYKAKKRGSERDVALKLLKPRATLKDAVRFEQEQEILSTLSHPNIVQYVDAGKHRGLRYLVTELIEWKTLAEAMEQIKKFPESDAIHLLQGISKALEYIASKNIVHRDLKPSNILIDVGCSKAVTPKIADFGSAQHTYRDKITDLDEISATTAYAAPEVFETKIVDGRTDVWSAGVILYKMLTGTLPFPNLRRNTDLVQIRKELSKAFPQVKTGNKKLDELISQMTSEYESRITPKQLCKKVQKLTNSQNQPASQK